jgi:hypothetical protein
MEGEAVKPYIVITTMVGFLFFSGAFSVRAEECYFNPKGAIFCANAHDAANAFLNFGFDIRRANLSYNHQLLHEAFCGLSSAPKHRVEITSRGRIATPTGWVPMLYVSFDDSNSGHYDSGAYTAAAYVFCK